MSPEHTGCRLCQRQSSGPIDFGQIRGRSVAYFECETCGYVQTEQPTWLAEAYASPINISDTGIMARNQSNVLLVLATLTLLGQRFGRVMDYAGGYGFLVRMLRDIGIDAYWADSYSENLVARGFEYHGGEAALVTAFEAFEHFVDPSTEMERLLSISPNILLTTNLIPTPTPKPSDWWYYGLDHGQHIGFYRRKTLEYLAERFNKNLLSNGASTHLFTNRKSSYVAWVTLQRTARAMPRLMTLGLRSKTWDDHLALSGPARD